ncbi:hypothetical protein [Roseinatronobacter sp. NSM]|uniref:hypothetical protein n=1 Tax=Roseinatronobacter sp. NSM TaxID=3457785 RepID=UPI0040369CFC
MLLSQIRAEDGMLHVVAREGTEAFVICDCASTYDLARDCANRSITLKQRIAKLGLGGAVDVEGALAQGRVLAPIHHPDPTQMFLSGAILNDAGFVETASAVATAWTYKGDGRAIGAPGMALLVNDRTLDRGTGPSVAVVYIVSDSGTPFRIGCAMANDFSDRILTTQSYASMAQGGLRPLGLGPELVLATLPERIRGSLRLVTDADAITDISVSTGQDGLKAVITRLERDHFASGSLCQPGQLHILVIALGGGITSSATIGDMTTLTLSGFGLPLSNPLHQAARRPDVPVQINAL